MINNSRKNKGITLIALIITIIILLLLAGISINLISGQDGIIINAQEAREMTRAAKVEEQRDLWKMNQEVDKYSSETTAESLLDLVNRLEKEGLLTSDEKDQILGNEEKGIEASGQVTIGDKTIVFGSTAKTLVQAFIDGDIQVGDYLDYKPVEGTTLEKPLTQSKTGVSAEQNYTVDMSTTWRVLGLNEDRTELLITSGSPIKKDGDDPYLHLAGAEGYVYCVETLDEISAIYHNSKYASQTRSMTMKDIERALGITVAKTQDGTEQIAYKTADESKTPLEGFYSCFGQSYTYIAGDYAPENYLGTGRIKVGDKVEGSSYALYIDDPCVVDPTSPIYDVLFSGTTESANYAKAYWLASPGVYVEEFNMAEFGPGWVIGNIACSGMYTFTSCGYFTGESSGVRPVISLKSNIRVEDIKTTTKEEAEWTTTVEGSGEQDLTKGEVFVNPIEFTIDGKTYIAEEGWTWETWFNSSCNTLVEEFVEQYGIISFPWKDEYGCIWLNGDWLTYKSLINSGEAYEIRELPPT